MKHEVQFTVWKRQLSKTPIEFEVKKGRSRLGTLRVSKGRVTWIAKHGGEPNTHEFGWESFAKRMEVNSRRD